MPETERRGPLLLCPAHRPAGPRPWQEQPLRLPVPALWSAPNRARPVRPTRTPSPTRHSSSSQNAFPLAGGSPRTLLREASLLHSLGWVPGLGARRVVRPAAQSTPLPQAELPRGCPGSCTAWSLPAHCPPEVALRTLGALSPGELLAGVTRPVPARPLPGEQLTTGNSSCPGPAPSCSCPLGQGTATEGQPQGLSDERDRAGTRDLGS